MTTQHIVPKIGAITATIISMNAMIGAGIFSTPAKLATTVGPAGIITYVFVIIAVLLMALSLAKVAQLYPQEGSFYNYTKQWGGHTMGTIAAGAYTLGVIIALGLLTRVAAVNLQGMLTELAAHYSYIPVLSINSLGILLVLAVIALNIAGVKFMQLGQIILLACTLFALIGTTILGFANFNNQNLYPFMPYGPSSLIAAIPTAIFAFFGFESAASLVSIVQDPQKNVPKALTYSICIVGLLYLAFIASLLFSIPNNYFTSASTPLSEVIITVFPNYKWLAYAISIAMLTALLGVLQSMSYSVSQLVLSFLKLLQNSNTQRFVTQKYAFKIIIAAVGICTLINFLAIKNLNIFFNLTALLIVFAFATSILTLVIKQHDKKFAQKAITYGGLITAAIIFTSALQGLFL